jgi:hypothetical protein
MALREMSDFIVRERSDTEDVARFGPDMGGCVTTSLSCFGAAES